MLIGVMPATYSDVLLAKLALQQRAVAGDHLRECLNAQEAGRRAGIEQSLGQVLIKRGFLSHATLRQLEIAREVGERSRRAKLTVQLLLRRGHPPEHVLRGLYENLRINSFPTDMGTLLESTQEITPDEHAALRGALDRAWAALHLREAEELAKLLQSAPGAYPRLEATPAYGAPAGYQPSYGAAQAPYGYPPHVRTAERQAYGYAPPPAPPPQLRTAERAAWGYPPPPAPPAQLRPNQLPPSPAPWRSTAERKAVNWVPAAPEGPQGYGVTAERAAHVNFLPHWAVTGERRAMPDGGGDPAAPAPLPSPDAIVPAYRRKVGALEEPIGPIQGYEIHERRERGTIGVIFDAIELASGRRVALKLLLPAFFQNPEMVERFRREVQVAASLDHPNIRRIYAGGESDGHLFLAMEHVEGESLQSKIDRAGKLPEGECLRWVSQVARAMDYYTKKALLHRDIRPENILITSDNRALVCDLGLSKRVYEEYVLTLRGTTLGEPYYVSPEQGMGVDEIDVRSDIYSLGVTLYHCLTGRVPFMGPNAGVIVAKHMREMLPDIRRANPAVSRSTATLIERMCAKRPQDRHASPKELLSEITMVRSELGGNFTPVGPLDPPSNEEKRAAVAVAKPGLWRRLWRAMGVG